MRQSAPLVAAVLAVAAAACSKSGAEGAPKTRPPPLVVVAKVAARDVPVEVVAPVELRPIAQAEVGSKTLGYLDAVLVDRGDKVRRGQLLALVRPSDLPDQLAAARGTLAQTDAAVALARTNLERAQKLAPSGIVSQQELQQAIAALASAEAQQAGAHAQTGALATRLGETRIESPLDGVVSLRRLDPGALVGPPGGGAILTIVKLDPMRVFITVTEREIAGIAVGKDAHVDLDALGGKPITGKVVRVAPTLDPTTRTLDAEVQLPNPDGVLRAGMSGRGAIVVEIHPHMPVVPAQAMQVTEGKKFVFVVQGDRAHRRAIETGVDTGTWLEIKSGLTEGDEIVLAGIDGLSDNAQVRVTRDIDPYSGAKLAAPAPSGSASDARD
jgi:RND family efflux transporter MFP subunit